MQTARSAAPKRPIKKASPPKMQTARHATPASLKGAGRQAHRQTYQEASRACAALRPQGQPFAKAAGSTPPARCAVAARCPVPFSALRGESSPAGAEDAAPKTAAKQQTPLPGKPGGRTGRCPATLLQELPANSVQLHAIGPAPDALSYDLGRSPGEVVARGGHAELGQRRVGAGRDRVARGDVAIHLREEAEERLRRGVLHQLPSPEHARGVGAQGLGAPGLRRDPLQEDVDDALAESGEWSEPAALHTLVRAVRSSGGEGGLGLDVARR
mmetsp:Transcript_33880/g.106155  ORF Transcript_33880/g.106155 Transcript_33880/m.106155 type:complete len:271 (+) Transcript_33880:159-971(+)